VSNNDWARRFGEAHGQRDRAAARDAQARSDVEHQREAACLERWPSVVAAIRSRVTTYNEGAGVEAITLVEDAVAHGVTLESAGNGRGAITLALDGTDVAVRSRGGADRPWSNPTWVSLSRTDDDAAEYLLRDWMERL
jgi:hypothetical protein